MENPFHVRVFRRGRAGVNLVAEALFELVKMILLETMDLDG